MLRIFFTPDDIARTRLAPTPDPLWETVLSLHVLGSRRADALHGEWRQAVTNDLRSAGLTHRLRTLVSLNPPTGYFPDFLTPAAGLEGLEAGLEAIETTPAERLRRDIGVLEKERPLPADVADLVRGEAAALRKLTDAIRAYFDVALAPVWPHIEAVVEGDRRRRVRAVVGQGTEGLLDSLRPTMRWRAGELDVDYPVDQEMHLDGRGLVLVPSYFCLRYPVTLLDPELPPVLVYPAQRTAPVPKIGAVDQRALAALLGTTRAAALAAIGDGCSTSDLARRVGISAAAASQHATVLRNAGLITSHRERNTMLHTLTALGTAVLNRA